MFALARSLALAVSFTAPVHLTSEQDKVMLGADVGAEAARKDDDFQAEGVKEVAAEKEEHWRDGGKF